MNKDRFKFRVWDKIRKDFVEWLNPDPMINCADGIIYCHERTDGGDILTNERFAEDRLVIQQSTGFVDIDDKLIYEGDFLEIKPDTLCRVAWDSFRFALKDKRGNDYHQYDKDGYVKISSEEMSSYKIVGNILENPELTQKLIWIIQDID